jgi:hypothetical protein
MTEHEALQYLRDNGYPEQLCKAGPHGLVEHYARFVAQLEHGFHGRLEDYRRHLDLRSLLTLLELDQSEEVRALDARFAAQLTPARSRLWESGPTNPFWDFAYPKNAKADLLADLKSEDLC